MGVRGGVLLGRKNGGVWEAGADITHSCKVAFGRTWTKSIVCASDTDRWPGIDIDRQCMQFCFDGVSRR